MSLPDELDTQPSGAVQLSTDRRIREGDLIEGQYRVVRQIGAGGMGVVVLAHDEPLDREVAIKLVRPALLSMADARAKFLAEARAMARLVHPNVIGVHAVGEIDGVPYLVMEYVPGRALDDIIAEREGAPLGVDEALGVLDQVCRGVSAMHAADVVHRDIKPGNVLIGPAFRVAVGDLGIARLVAELRSEGDDTVSGTPAYMAPEIRLGTPTDVSLAHRADVFSLGVLAYQLLTGRLPFLRAKVAGFGRPPPASELNPRVPSAVDAVLEGALAFDPEERLHSVDAFRRALVKAIHDQRASDGECPARVLVVDDDPNYRDLTRMILARAFDCTEIECTEDGAAALEAMKRAMPDLLVTDLDMPNMGGLELTAAVRELPGGADLPILVATAVGGPMDWRLLSRLQANGFLNKPFEPNQLVTLARAVLDAPTAQGE